MNTRKTAKKKGPSKWTKYGGNKLNLSVTPEEKTFAKTAFKGTKYKNASGFYKAMLAIFGRQNTASLKKSGVKVPDVFLVKDVA